MHDISSRLQDHTSLIKLLRDQPTMITPLHHHVILMNLKLFDYVDLREVTIATGMSQ